LGYPFGRKTVIMKLQKNELDHIFTNKWRRSLSDSSR